MKIEIPDDLYQRCAEHIRRRPAGAMAVPGSLINSGKKPVTGQLVVEHFIAQMLEQALRDSPMPAANARLEAALQQDPLTQCYTRKKFDDDITSAVSEALAHGQPLTARFIGVDVLWLREVNDRNGLLAGNLLLAEVADLLIRSFRPAPVYRIGGDEFVIWLSANDRRLLADFQFMFPIRFALIDLTVVLENNPPAEVCRQVREKIRQGIREGTTQGVLIEM